MGELLPKFQFTVNQHNGTVAYSVSANTGTRPRTGTMTIAGKTFTVYQEGVGQCAVTSFRINNGAAKTKSHTVTLNNTTTSSPTHFMASEFKDFGDAIWQEYSAAPYFTLRSDF